jgi:hypothetical protein
MYGSTHWKTAKRLQSTRQVSLIMLQSIWVEGNNRQQWNHFDNEGPKSKIIIIQTDKISQQPENCENRNEPDLVQAFRKKWWVESDFKAPNLPLSLRSRQLHVIPHNEHSYKSLSKAASSTMHNASGERHRNLDMTPHTETTTTSEYS